MINPLRHYSRLVDVPSDLAGITDIGEEVNETTVGLSAGTVEELWRRICAVYASGVQPGIQLCIRHQGQVILDRAIGHARGNSPGARSDAPQGLTVRTPINLFSAGKAVSAMLAHKLQELGQLDIDVPIADYIPGFARHGKARISLRDVLTHRAALHLLPISPADDFDLATLLDRQTLHDLICELKPSGRIGGPINYHALSGGLILAEVIRQATGAAPEDLLRRYLKEPLGLGYLDFGLPPAQLDRIAVNAATGVLPGPIAWQLQRIVGAPFEYAVEMSNDRRFLAAVVPSANVISTARDTTTLYQCLLDRGQHAGQRVFAGETVDRALVPRGKRASLDRRIGLPMLYSPGFMLGHAGLGLYGWNRRSTFGHLGLSNTLTWARRDTGTAVALLTTGKPILGPHLGPLLRVFSGLNALCENRLLRAA